MVKTARADVIVIGGGIAGLVAAWTAVGPRGAAIPRWAGVVVAGRGFHGGYARTTPSKIKDSLALAQSDWMGSAPFDRPQDVNPRAVAEAFWRFR